jgi:hypothetical protein
LKRERWQAHIDTCKQNKQSKIAYAKQHNLVYSQLLYWGRKLSRPSKVCSKPDKNFAAVKIKQSVSTNQSLGVLEFPGGFKLHIHDASLLNSLPDLWRH